MVKVVFEENEFVDMNYFDEQDRAGHKFTKEEKKVGQEAFGYLAAINFLDFFNLFMPKDAKGRFLKRYFLDAIKNEMKAGFFLVVLNELYQLKNKFGKDKNIKYADVLKGRGIIDLLVLVGANKLMEKIGFTKYLQNAYKEKDYTRADIEIYTTAILAGLLSGAKIGVLGAMAFGPFGAIGGGAYGIFTIYITYIKLKQHQKYLEGTGREFKLIEAIQEIYGYPLDWLIPENEFDINEKMGEVRKGENIINNLEEKFQNQTTSEEDIQEILTEEEEKLYSEETIDEIYNNLDGKYSKEELENSLGNFNSQTYIDENIIDNPDLNYRQKKEELTYHKDFQNCGILFCEEDTYAYYQYILDRELELFNKGELNEIEADELVVKQIKFEEIKQSEILINKYMNDILNKHNGVFSIMSQEAKDELRNLINQYNQLEYHVDKNTEWLVNMWKNEV